jgi:hypothetical protein
MQGKWGDALRREFMTMPEWLKQHGGVLEEWSDGKTWFVVFDGKPLYRLSPTPVRGQFGCAITQTNNGQRLPCESLTASEDAALQAGLEDLGKLLGWR